MDAETVAEIKRHFPVVADDVRSDVRGVAEGVSALRGELHREISGVRTEIDEVKAMIPGVERLEERRVS